MKSGFTFGRWMMKLRSLWSLRYERLVTLA